jgi:hypothetical protein
MDDVAAISELEEEANGAWAEASGAGGGAGGPMICIESGDLDAIDVDGGAICGMRGGGLFGRAFNDGEIRRGHTEAVKDEAGGDWGAVLCCY